MHCPDINKSAWMRLSAALLLGLNLPFIASCSGGHNDDSNHDAHSEQGQHINSMTDTVMATVVSIDAVTGQLTLDHEALTNIGMDAMTMGFQLDEGVSANSLKSGDKVRATVEMKPGKGFVITEVNVAK